MKKLLLKLIPNNKPIKIGIPNHMQMLKIFDHTAFQKLESILPSLDVLIQSNKSGEEVIMANNINEVTKCDIQ